MKHHRKRGRARRKRLHARVHGGPASTSGAAAQADAATPDLAGAVAPPNGATSYGDEAPNLDAMVSALLAEAQATEAQAQAAAEAQARALEVPVPAEAPLGEQGESEEPREERHEEVGHAPHARHRTAIARTHATPVRTRQRLVYLLAGITVAVLVIAVLSWMEWWDLTPVSLPDPQ